MFSCTATNYKYTHQETSKYIRMKGTDAPGLDEAFDNCIARKEGGMLCPMFCTYDGIKGPPPHLHTAVAELLVQEIQRLFIVDACLVLGFCSLYCASQS